jgi:hypothetical protein
VNWKQQLAIGVAASIIGSLVLTFILRSGRSTGGETVGRSDSTVAASTTTREGSSLRSTTPSVTATTPSLTANPTMVVVTSRAPTPSTTILPPVRSSVDLDSLRVDSAGYYPDTFSINGKLLSGFYFPSWSQGGYADFNLSRQFSLMTARVGLIDRSSPGVSGDLTITADGRTIYSASFVLGQSEDLDLDVTNVLRVHVQWDLLRLGAEGGIGNARVQ